MNKKKAGRPSRDPIDSLRTKIWFCCATILSGGKTPYWFWKTLGSEAGCRSSWYKRRNDGVVPADHVIEKVAERLPCSDRIFRALFWSILKGVQPTKKEIKSELIGFKEEFSALPEPSLMIDFFETHDDVKKPLNEAFRAFIGVDDCEDIALEVIIIMMAWAKLEQDTELWNQWCDLYHQFLPEFILGIDLPFKSELFDAVDSFAIKKERRNRIVWEHKPESWREEIPRFQLLLEKRYALFFMVWRDRIPVLAYDLTDTFCKKISKLYSIEVCKDDDLIMNSYKVWNLIWLEIHEVFLGEFNGRYTPVISPEQLVENTFWSLGISPNKPSVLLY